MAIRDFLIFDDTTPVPEEAQLGSGDTARLMLDSTRAMIVQTEAEADVFVIDTVAGIVTMSSVGVSGAIPTLAFYDTDCGDGDVSASIVVDATTTTTNIEEVDFSIYQQKTGTLTRTFFSDIDQGIWLYPLGESANPVSITTGGDLNIASKLTHDGDADTYLQFSADQLQLIVGGHTALNYDEGTTSTLAIDAEGLADISFGGGNVVFGGAEGNFDGNVGINVVPEIWHGDLSVVQLGGNGAWSSSTTAGATKLMTLSHNSYVALADGLWKYQNTDEVSAYRQLSGTHVFRVAGSGTADTDITWTDALTIDNSANIGMAVTPEAFHADWTALQVAGTGAIFGHTAQSAGSAINLGQNVYYDGSYKYIVTDEASKIGMFNGQIVFDVAVSGSADALINGSGTWTTALTIANDASSTFGGDIRINGGDIRDPSDVRRISLIGAGSLILRDESAVDILNLSSSGITSSVDQFIANGSGLVIGHTAQLTATIVPELQLLGTGGADSNMLMGRWSADKTGAYIRMTKSRAAIGSFAIVIDNDELGGFVWNPDDGVDYDTDAARFFVEVEDASPAAGDIGTAFVWETMAGGGASLTEKMRLTAGGNLELAVGDMVLKVNTSLHFDSGQEYITSDGSSLQMYVSNKEGLRLTAVGAGVIPSYNVTNTITASVTQTQGQQPLISAINEISVCANTNDTVTMPDCVSGMEVFIVNNGAETLQIFPASGDDLGAGVDTAVTLVAGSNVTYKSYNVTNWEQV